MNRKNKYIVIVIISLTFLAGEIAYAQWKKVFGPGSCINTVHLKSGNIFTGSDNIYISSNFGSSWKCQNSEIANSTIYLTSYQNNIYAVSEDEKSSTYDNKLLYSLDNGDTWHSNSQIKLDKSEKPCFTFLGSRIYTKGYDNIYFSDDFGINWNNVCKAPASLNCFVAKDSIIFAGTTNGFYISTNNGTTWFAKNMGLLARQNISSMIITENYLIVGTTAGGIFRSTNNGTFWRQSNNGLNNYVINRLMQKGSNVYATTDSCVYFSKDEGTAWNKINSSEISAGKINSFDVDSNKMIVGTNDGIFLSSDCGETWDRSHNIADVVFPDCFTYNKDTIFVVSPRETFYSANKGKGWKKANGKHPGYSYCLAANGNTLYVGTDSGGFQSSDYGATWSLLNIDSTIYPVYCLKVYKNKIFAGTMGKGIFISTDEGLTWRTANNGLEELYIYSIEAYENTLYAGGYGIFYFSTDDGETWKTKSNGLPKYSAILKIAADKNYIIISAQGPVYCSNDMIDSWSQLERSASDFVIYNGNYIFASDQITVYPSNGLQEYTANDGLADYAQITSINAFGENIYLSTIMGEIYIRSLNEIIPTSVKDNSNHILSFQLEQNFPNPFNPVTQIKYSVKKSGFVTLRIIDLLGREVKTLFNGNITAGVHTILCDATSLSSGVYFYQLLMDNQKVTKKMVLMR